MVDKFCKFLEGEELNKFVDCMDIFIFDCDGKLIILYRIFLLIFMRDSKDFNFVLI